MENENHAMQKTAARVESSLSLSFSLHLSFFEIFMTNESIKTTCSSVRIVTHAFHQQQRSKKICVDFCLQIIFFFVCTCFTCYHHDCQPLQSIFKSIGNFTKQENSVKKRLNAKKAPIKFEMKQPEKPQTCFFQRT